MKRVPSRVRRVKNGGANGEGEWRGLVEEDADIDAMRAKTAIRRRMTRGSGGITKYVPFGFSGGAHDVAAAAGQEGCQGRKNQRERGTKNEDGETKLQGN